MTLKFHKKSEYPKKLEALVNIISEVESIKNQLDRYFEVLSKETSNTLYPIRKLNTRDLEKSLMIQAVIVDRDTYAYVSQAFSVYRKLGYGEIIEVNSKSPEQIKYAGDFQKRMNLLHRSIGYKIQSYTKKME
ncbi:hypothetical protein [Peribacillus asahii]|uniref:hypothetical protein n=1 Tax=Peribacillus asahii TaxID=228899 RepID=UPI003810ECF3